jgi:hypothetical protein
MTEYDHRDEIPALLLPSSHSGRKFIEGRWNFTFQSGAIADELIERPCSSFVCGA